MVTPKRKITPLMEDVGDVVEYNMDDIMVPPLKKNNKIVGGKKIPTNVHISPLDSKSFRSEENVLKWKFVYHKKITPRKGAS